MRRVELILKRRFLGDFYTIGSLLIEGQKYCDTLEDTVRDLNKDGDLLDLGEEKVYGKTAIPYGIYDLELTYSPKYKRMMPLVKNVKHFEGIRIHTGNKPEDTDGCILLGENKVPGMVVDSKPYVERFIAWMEIETFLGTTFRISIV